MEIKTENNKDSLIVSEEVLLQLPPMPHTM